MEYICGDLLNYIRKRTKLPEQITKIIFKQIIEGLDYIHKNNIVHRDIKLDNILIDLTNTIKICDFGVSRRLLPGDIMHEHCGTPAYIAPEIFKDNVYILILIFFLFLIIKVMMVMNVIFGLLVLLYILC